MSDSELSTQALGDPEAPRQNGAQAPEEPPRGVRTMAIVRWMLVVAMAVVAALSVTYSLGVVGGATASASSTEYYCPMHPQVVQDHPGECPICSMSLVPKKSGASSQPAAADNGAETASHAGHRHEASDPYYCPMHPEETSNDPNARCPICKMKLEKRPASAPPSKPVPPAKAPPPSAAPAAPQLAAPAQGAAPPRGVPGLVPIDLGPDRVQLIGVRTARASREALVPELRTVGYISADESRLARVHSRFSGWIERLAVATTGQKVRRGQPLAGIYSVELLPAQQELIVARGWSGAGSAPASGHASGGGGHAAGFEDDARKRLEVLGMSRYEIDRVASSGKPMRVVSVSSPISGHVVRKNAVQGGYVQPGTELFEIADLSRVWVLADVYEHEISRVSVGQGARVEVAAYPGKRFEAKVAFIYPTLDANTRTLRVRLELENKKLELRPGMYGDVVIALGQAEGVVVPAEALVDTGEHQYVFVAKPAGRFEPRAVKAGARIGDKLQILEGLAEGETVVTTANFLLDSESRLHAAIEGVSTVSAPATSGCDAAIDKTKFPEKYVECRECERVHQGMGTMEEDCKKAIAKPWR